MRKIIFSLLTLSICWVANGNAQQIIGVTENWPPYNYADNGIVKGLATEIVQATLAQADLAATVRVYPWARAYHMALKQENVLIYSICRSPEREALFKWIGPMFYRNIYLIKLKERTDIVLSSLEDAKRYRLGVMNQDTTHQFLLSQGFEEGVNLEATPSEPQNVKKLFAGRIDLLVQNDISLAIRMHQLDLPFSKVTKALPLFDKDQEFYMAFSKQTSDELVNRVRKAFAHLQAEGIIDAILAKHLNRGQQNCP